MNFSIVNDGTSVTSTTASSTVALPTTTYSSENIMIDNPGPYSVYVRAGASTVTASTLSMRISPGEKSAYRKGTSTHIAVISPEGTQTIVVYLGEGS